MNLQKLEEAWGMARGLLLVAFILIITWWAVRGYCLNLEMDYNGPGSEIERFTHDARDEANREAAERVGNDIADQRESSAEDRERASDYASDHEV